MNLSLSQRLGIRLGIEELAEGATGEEPTEELGGTVALPDAPEETVEGGMVEAAEAEDEVVEEVGNVEAVESTVETLEKIVLGLESAMKNGGCTGNEAFAYQIALESAFKPFGMHKQATASLENIGTNGNTRLEATRVTLEGAKETLQKWLNGLMALWEKVYTSVKGWLMKVFDGVAAIKKRAEELKTKAEAISKSAASKQQKSTIAFDANKVASGASAPKSSDVVAGLNKVMALVTAQVNTSKGVEGTAVEAMTSTLTAVSKELAGAGDGKEGDAASAAIKDASKKAIETIIGSADAYADGLKPGNKEKYGADGVTAKVSEPYLGNRVVVVTMPEAIEKEGKVIDLDVAVRAFNLKMDDAENKATATEVAAPEAKDAVSIADNVIKLMDILSKHRENWRDRETRKGKLTAAIKAEVNKINDKSSAALANTTKKVGSAIQSYSAKTANFEAQVVSYVSRAATAALDYANKGLQNYGTEEPKKDGAK